MMPPPRGCVVSHSDNAILFRKEIARVDRSSYLCALRAVPMESPASRKLRRGQDVLICFRVPRSTFYKLYDFMRIVVDRLMIACACRCIGASPSQVKWRGICVPSAKAGTLHQAAGAIGSGLTSSSRSGSPQRASIICRTWSRSRTMD